MSHRVEIARDGADRLPRCHQETFPVFAARRAACSAIIDRASRSNGRIVFNR
jgi:hypothetical protein